MGYVPPMSPMQSSVDEFYARWLDDITGSRRASILGPYQRYVRDLYGSPRRDWMSILNYGLLACIIGLGVIVVSAVGAL